MSIVFEISLNVTTGLKTSQNHRFKNQPGRGEDAGRVFGWSDMPQDA